MSPTLRIALRFLLAKKRSMVMSLAGIVFGVGFFIFTQAQTSGFQEFFIRTILGTNGAVRVEDQWQPTLRSMDLNGAQYNVSDRATRRYVEGVEWPRLVREAIRAQFPNVVAISEVLQGSVVVEGPLRAENGQIFGIKLDDHLGVSDLARQIIRGDLDAFRGDPNGVILGAVIAQRLQVTVGEPVTIQARGQTRRYTVRAIFQTGVSDIDKSRLFAHIGEVRSLLKRPFGASFLQLNVRDRERAEEDALRMDSVIQHSVIDWKERERSWLSVFTFLRVSSALAVSTIILISGLGMFNTLAMIVLDKTREISILRSMGYTRRDISRIFLWQGGIVLVFGTMLGWIFGLLMTVGVERLPIRVRGVFSTDHFVVEYSIWHYIVAAAVAGVIVMIASLVPARRAARLEPGDVIRGTAT